MQNLNELLSITDEKVRFIALKKAFMPYTSSIEIDGVERQALAILLNLSLGKPEPKDWLDISRARQYFGNAENLTAVIEETRWIHTHNLKYPDCRVAKQSIIGSPLRTNSPTLTSFSLHSSYGWAHNASAYRHTIWLLNPFLWRGNDECLLSLILKHDDFWQSLLVEFGFGLAEQGVLFQVIDDHLNVQRFPDCVDARSKQVLLPWQGDYLSVTPVVSHALQQEVERLSRDRESDLRFRTITLPNSASIGNLCGSLGGAMKVLSYPIGVSVDHSKTLIARKGATQKYFDDYQLCSKKTCSVLAHLAGFDAPKTAKGRDQTRRYQLKIIRKQIARWLLPLIELRDIIESEPHEMTASYSDGLVSDFLSLEERELPRLLKQLNQRLHLTLQNYRSSNRFAYHPKLLQPLKSELVWILNKLAQPEDEENAFQNHQYIYLSALRSYGTAAQSSPYLCGCPSLTAVWGFVHRYQLNLERLSGTESLDLEFTEFALFVRDESLHSNTKLTEPSVLASVRDVSPVKRPTILPEVGSDIVFDLVIKVRGDQRLSEHVGHLKSALPLNFAGGALFQPEISKGVTWLRALANDTDLFQVVKGLPSYGRWLIHNPVQPRNFSELETYITLDKSLLPISNGFHLLEKPASRGNARTRLHAYAENNLALAKRLNPIDVRLGDKWRFIEQVFWSIEETTGTILIKNRGN